MEPNCSMLNMLNKILKSAFSSHISSLLSKHFLSQLFHLCFSFLLTKLSYSLVKRLASSISVLVIHCHHCLFCLPVSVPVPCASGIPYSLFHLFPVPLCSCLTRSYLLHVDTLGKCAVNHPASFKSLLKMSLLTIVVSRKG